MLTELEEGEAKRVESTRIQRFYSDRLAAILLGGDSKLVQPGGFAEHPESENQVDERRAA